MNGTCGGIQFDAQKNGDSWVRSFKLIGCERNAKMVEKSNDTRKIRLAGFMRRGTGHIV